MAKLNEEARMTIKTLAQKGLSNRETARLLGVTEGAVRYQRQRMEASTPDGRSQRRGQADAYADIIETWREALSGGALNLAELHEWLVCEHDYKGSLRSVQRYWKKTYPAPKLRARRRIETPPGAQSQVDWAHFPGVIVRGRRTNLLAFRMVLSHSRYGVVVWSHKKDQLAWHRCHNEAFRRLGGVTATVRVDNEKTAVVGCRRLGPDQPSLSALCSHAPLPRRCLCAETATGQGQGRTLDPDAALRCRSAPERMARPR